MKSHGPPGEPRSRALLRGHQAPAGVQHTAFTGNSPQQGRVCPGFRGHPKQRNMPQQLLKRPLELRVYCICLLGREFAAS